LLVIPGRVGLVATESIASGVPIVTTRIPLHAPEFYYLKEGVNCIISEPDVDSYSSAIVLGLSSDFQVKMRAGLNADAGKYTIENMVKNYVNAVEELLKGSEK
jgi:glycosyltransferase involved in cell wall biosynthesis